MWTDFFSRRKILKKANSLDLTPVRVQQHEITIDNRVDILVPRFKNIYLKRALQSKKKEEYIRIHLDSLGSAIWLLIDGKNTIGDICSLLSNEHAEKLNPPEETEERLGKFISRLYQERYLTFKEFGDKK